MTADVVSGAAPGMSIRIARELIAVIQGSVDQALAAMTRLYEERAWLYLGYGSWEELCAEEFRPLALNRTDRAEVVQGLRSAGMSTRAIGSALGVSPGTVHAELSGVQNRTPDAAPFRSAVTGTDGKTYPRERGRLQGPRRGRARTLAAEYAQAIDGAARAISHIRGLHMDQRFSAEWGSLGVTHGAALADLLAAMTGLEKELRSGPKSDGAEPGHACAGPGLCRTVGCLA